MIFTSSPQERQGSMAQIDHKEKELFLAKAQAFLDNDLYQEAEELAESRLSNQPEDIDAKVILCQAWMRTGRIHKVKAMLRDVEEVITDLSRLYLVMGDMCRKGGLTQEAIRFYRRFLTLNPDSGWAKEVWEKLNTLEGVQDQQSFRDGLEDGGGKVEKAHISPDLYTLTLAELYIRQDHYDMAREVLEAILQKEPGNQKAATMIQEIDQHLNDRIEKDMARERKKHLANELTRWLQKLTRMNGQAMS
jgi:tetratricopeptide (TPR) repeat protein